MKRSIILFAIHCLFITALAQENNRTVSSSIYLQPAQTCHVIVPFSVVGEGQRFAPVWGLDQAWISEQNMRKGINHMGKENISIARSCFRTTKPLVGDTALAADPINKLRERNKWFNLHSDTLPLVLTSDQEAGVDEYYRTNGKANVERWSAMINAHVKWLQENSKHPVVGVSPFNEPDYWQEEGATATNSRDIAKRLKEEYASRFNDIAIVGGNTLNDDKASEWFTPGKDYYDWGNTHQLAGSMNNYKLFHQLLAKQKKVGYNDEMHNVAEAMVGLENGMTVGIWWGFDSRTRGEFCQISRHGERLAYGEHRNNWTAASVWRHDDGRVKAFIGSSERQAATTDYLLVSTDRDVYYDGYGPVREYLTRLPGGTGYQKGQTNAERVIDVTWGEDVAPGVVNGLYRLVNKKTGGVVTYTSNGSNIILQRPSATNKKQQWNVMPCTNRTGGDLSFLDIEALDNSKIRMNVKNFSTVAGGELIAWTQDLPSSNEQWYVEYVGDGYYYLRNRESALYLAAASNSAGAKAIQTTMPKESASNYADLIDRMLFRFLPVDVTYETQAPEQPVGLRAEAGTASVALAWDYNTEDDVEGYMVLRAKAGTDEWNTIARKLTTNSFVDNNCRPGTAYKYKVKAIDCAQNLSKASAEAEATPTGERSLIAHWQMEENTNDATENMMDAVCSGNVKYVDSDRQGQKALRLTGSSSQYVQLPYEVASSEELTVAMWVYLRSSSQWQRLFDFGNDADHYMFLTTCNSYTNVMRFAIKNGGSEQTVDCKAKLPMQQWKHVAVTMGKDKTTVYVDGVEAGSSTGITIRPSDVSPVLNYLGRSQFPSDPFMTADLDDVRIYNYAVSADDVKTMMDGGELTAVESAWNLPTPQTVYGLDGVKRTAPQKGVNIINGKKVVR